MISSLLTYGQPISGLIIGFLVLAFYGYLFLNKKQHVLPWIAKNIFRNPNMIPSAEDLFNVASSFIVVFALLWIGLAVYHLMS